MTEGELFLWGSIALYVIMIGVATGLAIWLGDRL